MPAAPVPDDASPPSDEELVESLLDRWEEHGDEALERACREHPERAEGLRRRVARLAALGLLPEASPPDTADAGPASMDAIPERLGPFRLLRRLGGGGMGVVYLARQQGLERDVALKLVRPELLYFGGARERFAREARVVGALTHPSLVPVHAVGEHDGLPWLAMERIAGASVEQLVGHLARRDPAALSGRELHAAVCALVDEERRLDEAARGEGAPVDETSATSALTDDELPPLFSGSWERACLGIAEAVAAALAHAASQGVLHRDVKPGNIMVTPAGRVVLLDFGLATVRGDARLTATGSLLGSLAYLAPELVRGRPVGADPRLDVYGLGASLYELLTLRPAFAGSTTEQVRSRILEGRVAPLAARLPGVSADADALVRVAMDPDPGRRHVDAARMAEDLRRLLEGRAVVSRPPGPLVMAWRAARRHPALATTAAFVLTLLIAAPSAWALITARHAERLELSLENEARARRAAEDARREAEQAREQADAQRALAETHYAWAREAVDAMRAAVEDEGLEDLPGFDGPVRHLREQALRFYERFTALRPDDPRLRLDQLWALHALGELQVRLGRDDEAEGSFARLAAAAEDLPASAEGLDLHARALTGLAVCHDRGGRGAQAAALHARSLELRIQRVEGNPDDEDARRALAQGLVAVGTRARLDGDLAGAEAVSGQAVTQLEALLEAHPDDEAVRLQLVRTRHELAHVLELRGRPGDAVDQARRMLEQAEPLGIDRRSSPGRRTTLAVGKHGLAANLAKIDRPAEAETVWREAVAELEALLEDFPERPEVALLLGAAWDGLASLLADQERFDESRTSQARGLAVLEAAAARWPERHPVVQSYAIALTNAAIVARRDGQLDLARARLDGAVEHITRLRQTDRAPRLRDLLIRQLQERESLEREAGREDQADGARQQIEALRSEAAGPG